MSPEARLKSLWKTMSRLPGGKRLFSFLVGRMAPYTGTMGAQVLELDPPHCRTQLKDRRFLHNHLRSIHAMALGNFAELTSGLAVVGSLPDDLRGILKGFEIEYLKKARGTLEGRADLKLPDFETFRKTPSEWKAEVTIHDASGECVVRGWARWYIGPRK